MPMQPFHITVSVSITPSEVKDDIETIFDAAYKGERGTDESISEFLERKLEQHILDVYGSRKSQSEGAAVTRSVQKDITAAATVKQRKDKPVEVVKPEGIGDTVSSAMEEYMAQPDKW